LARHNSYFGTSREIVQVVEAIRDKQKSIAIRKLKEPFNEVVLLALFPFLDFFF